MSITDKLNKIKGKLGIDNFTILYLIVIIGVGISAFGLGRLSTENNYPKQDFKVADNIQNQLGSALSIEKNYVASKNGKMYYPLGCSGANRIKLENQIWFATTTEAERSGYQLSTSCK